MPFSMGNQLCRNDLLECRGEFFGNNLNVYCTGKVLCPLLENNFTYISYDFNH